MKDKEKLLPFGSSLNVDNFRDKRDAEYYFNVLEGNNYGFENYAGPSAFVLYSKDTLKVVAASRAYLAETSQRLCCEQTSSGVAECLRQNPLELNYQKDGKLIYQQAVKRAIATGQEQQCETWRKVFSQNCGESEVCLSSRIKLLASGQEEYLLYVTVQDITEKNRQLEKISQNEEKFRSAADQVNLYAWEYDIATKEMRPCSRCMRDLGLPPVIKNYPEPVIESGLFPQDYADMYRTWHRQLAQGVDKLEGIIPLTKDRIPFYVRYTTEFNEEHQPVRAFASATRVREEKKQSSVHGLSKILSSEYQTVMQIDFKHDSVAMVRYGQDLPGWLHEQAQGGKTITYADICSRYMNTMVHPDDVMRVKGATTAAAVEKALVEQTEYKLLYRVLYAGRVHFRQLRFIRLEGEQLVYCAMRGYDELLADLQEAGLKL